MNVCPRDRSGEREKEREGGGGIERCLVFGLGAHAALQGYLDNLPPEFEYVAEGLVNNRHF